MPGVAQRRRASNIPALGDVAKDGPLRFVAFVHRAAPEHNAGAEWMLHAILADLVAKGHSAHVFADVKPAELDGVTMGPPTGEGFRGADVAITHLDRTRAAISLAQASHTPLVHLVHNDRQLWAFGVRDDQATLVVHNSQWIADTYTRHHAAWTICRPPVFSDAYATKPGQLVTLLNLTEPKGAPALYELAERMSDVGFLGVRGAYGYQQPAPRLANLEIIEQTPNVRDDVYARTSVLLVPSSYESWGRVAVEAMGSGIPVIAHPTPGLIEAVGDAAIFVDRNDLDGWEAAVRSVLSGPGRQRASVASLRRSAQLDIVARRDLDDLEIMLRRAAGSLSGSQRSAGGLRTHPRPHKPGIDVYGSERHYVDHLAPLWRALPTSEQGSFWCTPRKGVHAYAEALGLPVRVCGNVPGANPVVVASFGDERDVAGRQIALVEHGAGQSYSDHIFGAEQTDREAISLFICPNDTIALRARDTFPHARIEVVGCPKLDVHAELAARRFARPEIASRTVAFSWRWEDRSAAESRSGWMHYRAGFAAAVVELHAAGCRVIGHGHPRALPTLRREYDRAGIEVVDRLDDVIELADVLVCDNSSAIFEAAACGVVPVFANAPWYRRNVCHGLRFWTYAHLGPNVANATEIPAAVEDALDNRASWLALINAEIGGVYAHRGDATERAVKALHEWAVVP